MIATIIDKLYSPVYCELMKKNHDDFGDDHEGSPISQHAAANYADAVHKAILRVQVPEAISRGLMDDYYDDDSVNKKVHSLFMDVEIHDGRLWCVATLKLMEPLTPEEFGTLIEEIESQYSDAFGEKFGQREIEVDDGKLRVHLWSGEDEFYIVTEREFRQRLGLEPLQDDCDLMSEAPATTASEQKARADASEEDIKRMADNITTNCLNGELKPGDLVLSMPYDYACLVGTVLSITKVGTPEHASETENETDGVHVNFMDTEYSDKRIREIEEMFTDLYDQPMTFGECPIDDTIMSPDTLIRITGIEEETLKAILDSREAAESLYRLVVAAPESPAQAALKEPDATEDISTAVLRAQLIERLDSNLSDYFDTLRGFDGQEIADTSGEIGAMMNAHYYMSELHNFHASELQYLLKFQNPLEVVGDAFEFAGFKDRSGIMWDIFDKQDALRGDYELMPDESKMNALREKLLDRLDENLDYMVTALQKDMAETYKPGQSISIAKEITDVGAAHAFLWEYPFSETEAAYLLQYENPLNLFAERWEVVTGGAKSVEELARDIFAGVHHKEVFDKRNVLRSDYPLIKDETSVTDETEKETVANKDELLTQIAKKHCRFETLETRKSDSLDFRDVSVWGLKAALEEAYTAGLTRQIERTMVAGAAREDVRQEHTAGDKPSVLDQIREAAKMTKEPHRDKPARDKIEPEH